MSLGSDIYDALISTDKPSEPGTPFAIEDEDARSAWEDVIGPLIEGGAVSIFRPTVKDKDLTAPPVLPPGTFSPRARYIVGAGATGAWAGKDGQIAEWYGSSWYFEVPEEGWSVPVADEDLIYTYLGPLGGPFAWEPPPTGGSGPISISNLWADGSGIVATDAEDAFEEVVADLASDGAGDDGAGRIGAEATGSYSAGSVRTQLDEADGLIGDVADDLADHLADAVAAHDADAISVAVATTWADASSVNGGTVDDVLEDIVADLASLDSSGGGSDGTDRIGADAHVGSPDSLGQSTLRQQIAGLLTHHNAHLNDTAGAHDASAIAKGATPNWRTGSSPGASNVEDTVDNMVTELADQTGITTDGASRIGAEARAGSPNALAQGTIRSQLNELQDDVNNHLNDTSAAHDSSAIAIVGAGQFEDGSAPTGANLESFLDSFVDMLGDHTNTASDGARRIGAEARTSGALSLAQGSVGEQLQELLVYLAAQDLLRADPFGFRTTYTNASTITATPTGGMVGDTGWVPLTDGSTVKLVSTTSAFTCALGTSGAGGLHNAHAEAANTGYDYYWAWGATPGLKLFCVPRGTVVDAAKIAALTGGTFTHWSRFFWFTSNDNSSNIREFDPKGERKFAYRLLANVGTFTSNTPTQITFLATIGGGHLLPVATKAVTIGGYLINAATTARDFKILRDAAAANNCCWCAVQSSTSSGFGRGQALAEAELTLDGLTVGTTYWAQWANTGATTGADLYVRHVEF